MMDRAMREKLEAQVARYLAHEDGDESRHNTTPYPERAADIVEYFILPIHGDTETKEAAMPD